MIPNVSPFSRGDKVVAYCRYSEGDEQGLKNQSTEEQAEAIRRFCGANGLELVRIFADPFASGRSVTKRDHYLEMLSYLLHGKRKEVAGVVLWDYERYGRNYDQATLDAARLRMAGYKIFSLQQPITDTSPFAKVMEAMYMASAQNQSDMISADVRRALQANFQKWKVIPRTNIPFGWVPVEVDMGTYSNGSPRTGYRAEPDPDLAPKIRAAILKRFQGATLDEMKSIIGGPFSNSPRNSIRVLMLKPLLYGQMTFGGTTIEDYCEPIIEKAEWDRLQTYNAHAPREHHKPLGHYSQNRPLLSGLLYCGVCGKKAFLDRRKAKGHVYETYYCNDYHVGFRRELIESLVIEKGIELLSKDAVERATDAIFGALQQNTDNSTLEAEIAKIDRKIARISAVIEDSDDVPATLVKRLSELEKERAAMMSMVEPSDDPEALDKLLEQVERLRSSIVSVLLNEKSTVDQKRDALSLFVHSVTVFPDRKVLIRHSLPGMVAGQLRQNVSAPLRGHVSSPQLLEVWIVL